MTADVVPGADAPATTPSVGGYVLAVLVSWPLVSAATGWWLEPGLGALDPGWLLLTGELGLVIAPIGVFVVDTVCARVDAQWVHVVVAGIVGLLAATVPLLILTGLELSAEDALLAALVGVSTAAGRFAVTPLVPVVRLRHPEGASYWRRLTLR